MVLQNLTFGNKIKICCLKFDSESNNLAGFNYD